LGDIIGHVDNRDRPIVLLSVDGMEDGFPVIVDTGFNGELLINDTEISRLQCRMTGVEAPIEFANKERRTIVFARSRVVWFGRAQDVRVWVTAAEPDRAAAADEPVGLLGTALLKPHRLTVDFATRRVVISENE
jgi:predicted aspartyl protease